MSIQNQILQGDCLDLFKTIPDNSIDVVFADPPFNLDKKYKNNNDKLDPEIYLDWCFVWLKESVRVLKPTGSLFVHNIPKWLTFYTGYLNEISIFRHWITWDALTSPMGKSLQPAHYGILYYSKTPSPKFYEIRTFNKRCRNCDYLLKDYGGRKKEIPFFGPLLSDVWTDIHRCKHDKYRDNHPCQLPIHLLERLILMSSDEGDTLLDPFIGTGTTAIASKRLGRNYIGFELSETYKNTATEKLNKEHRLSKIGNIWLSCFINKIYTIRDADSKIEEFRSWFEAPGSSLYQTVQTIKGPGLKPEAFDPPEKPNSLSSIPFTPYFEPDRSLLDKGSFKMKKGIREQIKEICG